MPGLTPRVPAMSVFLTNDEDPGDQVASNRGWGDFGTWVESLDAGAFPKLSALREHGCAEPVSALRKELAKALKKFPPTDASALAVARAVAEALANFAADDPAIAHS